MQQRARRRASVALAFGAASVCLAPTSEAQDRPAPQRAAYRDGASWVQGERLGAAVAGRGREGRPLTRVTLRYSGRPRAVPADVDDTAIVSLEPGASSALPELGLRAVRPLMRSLGLWLVEDEAGDDGLAIAERLADPAVTARGVRGAVPNLYLRVRAMAEPFVPDDPRLPGQWYFEGLRMTEAWGLSVGSPTVSIVVVDTGCDLDHPDLVAKMDPGRDVVDGDDDPSFDPGASGTAHGTACAGLVAADTNNGEGIAGGCPECRLRCVRMLSDESLPISASVEAFDFAFEVDAAIISNSWGYVDSIPAPAPLAEAIVHVFESGRGGRGALVLFAAGNDDRAIEDDEVQALRGVLNIGAINHFDEQTPFTNRGPSVDLVAPTGTLSTDIAGALGDDPGDYTTLFGGTSSACPVAAGIAGLLVAAAPERTSAALYEVLIRTARPAPYAVPDESGHDPVYGHGIIDPVPALEELLGVGAGGAGGAAGAGGDGAAAQGGGLAADPIDEDAAGCSCEVAGRDAPVGALSGIGAALWLLARRRRGGVSVPRPLR